jgi:DnaJ-like protein
MRLAADERALLALLSVDENSPWEDVRRAFRDAVRANHPDLHPGDADGERRLKALNAAWESINTPGKWAAYILQPASGGSKGSAAHAGGGASAASVGLLRVHRQQRGSAGLLNWWLELDGEVIASIENGGVSIVEAGPGCHSLRVFHGSHSSVPLHVDLRRGQELVFGCRQHESVRISLVSRRRSLVLELLNG